MTDDLSRLKIDPQAKTFTRKKRRKFIYLAVAAALMFLFVILYAAGILRPSVPVDVAIVSRIYPTQTYSLLNASGYVVAQRKAAVASKITGRLVSLAVEEGNPVKKGQIIATLEHEDVSAARAQAEANLAVAGARVSQVQADLHEATLNYERKKQLLARQVVSQAEFDLAEARYKDASARRVSAKAAVTAAEAALDGANVALEYTRIRAPFDAVVLTKNADIGDIVTPIGAAADAKAAVVTIADLGSLVIEADVSESNVSRIKPGQPCEIQLDALPKDRFRGTIHMIVPTADRAKASILVKVKFIESDPRILPEMSARVSFLDRPIAPGDQAPRTAIPLSALRRADNRVSAFRINGRQVTEVPLRTGLVLGDFVEITSGLTVGERVVIDPPRNLKTGTAITINER
ncbi:MAG: efflux RND transporter periplasmic adaptor subunit [Syntrophales bacterium]|jgi:RND family efflux transporter MFP subunit|nr:efflux RND transporter periplasmic adaptor subunit [Syntrophales bacterium]